MCIKLQLVRSASMFSLLVPTHPAQSIVRSPSSGQHLQLLCSDYAAKLPRNTCRRTQGNTDRACFHNFAESATGCH